MTGESVNQRLPSRTPSVHARGTHGCCHGGAVPVDYRIRDGAPGELASTSRNPRISEATLAATIGMQRLARRTSAEPAIHVFRQTLAADFANSKLCQNTGVYSGLLQTLRSMQVTPDTVAANNPDLQNGAIKPDQILLAGAYQNADRFIAGYLPPAPASGASSLAIPLQPGIGALARYRYSSTALSNQTATPCSRRCFPAGRVLSDGQPIRKVAYTMILELLPRAVLKATCRRSRLGAPFPPLGGSSSVCQFAGGWS